MEKSEKALWRVEAIVKPMVKWEQLGISSFVFEADKYLTLQEQFEDRTLFSINIIAHREEVHDRAELLMKSFLALLDLEAQRRYSYKIGHMRQLQPTRGRNGLVFLNMLVAPLLVVPKPEDWDLTLLKAANRVLKELDADKGARVLIALNFLYDALTALTDTQCFLTIYGGLSYLTSSIGREEKSLDSAEKTFSKFRVAGVLTDDEETYYVEGFRRIHIMQYKVIKSNKVKKEELERIKTYFTGFLLKYMEYARLQTTRGGKPRLLGTSDSSTS